VLALLFLVVGFGLMVAALAVRFHDVLELNRVVVLLIGYLAPTFYPISIVSTGIRHVIELNPIYHDLNLFRNLAYLGSLSSWQTWVAAFGSGLAMLAFGLWLFARGWRTAASSI
jgi:ABC-type polysaccharide/polyol phosphate export permease